MAWRKPAYATRWPERSYWTTLLADPPQLLHVGADAAQVRRYAPPGLVYLASPYSREVVDEQGRWCEGRSLRSALEAADEAAELAVVGVTAISPIVQAALMVTVTKHEIDPLDAEFWERWCRPLLCAARSVVVPDIKGWWRSEGVWREVEFALAHSMPVFLAAERVPEGE